MGDAFLPSTVRFARKTIEWIKRRPTLYKLVYGLALRHDRSMGFRQYGLMRDDLIPEEHEIVYEAMKRLTDKEMFDRTFRLRRAVQLNLTKEVLPPEQWVSVDQDIPYLWRHIEAIAHEQKEKADFDALLPEQLLSAAGSGLVEPPHPSSTTVASSEGVPPQTEERLVAASSGSGGRVVAPLLLVDQGLFKVPKFNKLNMTMDHYYSGNGGDSYVGSGGRGPERHRRGSRDSYASRPYDRPPSQGGRSSGNYERGRRLEDVYDTDELLTMDQFRRYHQEGAGISWEEYVRSHRRAALERFFARHKGEAWLGERYDPFHGPIWENSSKDACHERATRFKTSLGEGKFDALALVDGPDLEGGAAGGEASTGATTIPSSSYSHQLTTRTFPAAMNLPERLANTIDRSRLPTITLSNIGPTLTRESLEEMLRSCANSSSGGSQLISLELTEPIPEKANYRLGWATWSEGTELGPVVALIEEYVPPAGPGGGADKIYCSASKAFSWQIRLSEGHSQRLEQDLERVSTLVNRLDKLRGLEQLSMVEACRERSGGDSQRHLDMLIVYLRHVHYVCYYSGAAGTGPHDLARQAGDLVIRRQAGEEVTGGAIGSTTDAAPPATVGALGSAADFDLAVTDLQERLTVQYEPFTEDALLERHVAKVEEGRYRCTNCSKLFKGVDFVIKHLRLKHEDLTRGVVLEVATLNAFLRAPPLSVQLALPKASESKEPQHRRDERYGRPHSHHSQNDRHHHGGRDYRRRAHPPPPPPKDAVADPRRLRQYVDWDAPATGDMEISYE